MTTTTETANVPTIPHGSQPEELLDLADRVLAPTYRRPRRLFTDGDGAVLRDADGVEFLDMTSGIAVLALGHRSETVARALHESADRLVHISNLYHSAPAIELAARLVDLSFADSVFFANSGAEAIEAALKFARLVGGADRRGIVHFTGSFHGRTLGALAATDRADYQEPFRPLAGGFRVAPWSSDEALGMIDDRTAAVVLEPIQGEMGVRVADDGWVRRVRRRCDEVGALLLFDEIQCGLGRTGRLWAHEDLGVEPDILTLAKPLAGGLPIGAVLMTRQVADALSPGMHGTTFGGGPLVTHVALRVLERVADPRFLARVRERGTHLGGRLEQLAELPEVEEIRGRGLMRGVRVSVPVGDVVEAAFEHRLLVVPSADNVIRILPPLDVSEHELDACVDRLHQAVVAARESAS
jgi:acetylornithine/N-succinyldiaminopimelate aminotransferase